MLKSILLLIIICISTHASTNLKGQNYLLPGEQKYRLIVKFAPGKVLDIEEGKPYFSAQRNAPPQSRSTLQKYRFNQIVRFSDEEKKLMRSEQTPPPGGEKAFNKYNFRGLASLENAEEMTGKELLKIADELEKLDFVEYAALEPVNPPPPPATPDLSSYQDYRNSSFLNIEYAWSLGIKGQGIRIADIEWGFDYDHEDLKRSRFIELRPTTDHDYDDHGTSVAGILFAIENSYGMTGMVNQADTFYGISEVGTSRSAGIFIGLERLRAGDVFIYEMQTVGKDGNYVPADFMQFVWDITKKATDDGIIVVAAAGNGGQDLDDSYYNSYMARGDNGSIIVGAGSANSLHNKLYFSTYGSRVNVQGWGGYVASTGSGDLYNGGEHATYTSSFSGTSSATPIVASAVVAIQSYAKNELGIILTPREMRSLLIETGQAQGLEDGHIGPFPDVRAAIEKLRDQYSTRVKIVSNVDDTILYTESVCSLHWNSRNPGVPIALQLLNSRNELLTISDDISADTQYSWLISSDITTGNNYRLVLSNPQASDTSGFFTIMRKKLDTNTVLLDQSGISVVYVSNQENKTGNGAATNVLDNKTNTIWNTQTAVNHPHSIILKTSSSYGISGISYTRGNEDVYGIITDYRIEISADSISWDTVASGVWNPDSVISLVRFDAAWGNYVRLTSLASYNGNSRASAAQIHLYIEQGYKREQTIAFSTISDTVNYGEMPFLLDAQALSGLSVTFTSSNTAVISISSDSVYIKGAGTAIVTASQSGDDTWKEATDVEQSITVKKRAVFIRGVTAQNKVYDGTNVATLSGVAELDSVLTGDSVELGGNVSAVFIDKNANANKPVTVAGYVLNGPDAPNYSLSVPIQLWSAILKAPLAISANDTTKGQGLTDPEFKVTCDGFAAGEDISVLAGTLQIVRASEGEEPGEYAIVPSGVSSDNYEISFVSGTLTIEPKISVKRRDNPQRGHTGPENSPLDDQRQSKQNDCSITFSNNPVDLSSGAANFKVKVPCQSVLKIVIYDASGDMLDSRSVRTNNKGESGVLTWDLRNRKGLKVSKGTYLVQVEGRGLKTEESYRFRGKLGVGKKR
ncbi:MAG TPA: S8 family serine peptidase [Chitinispirillaceae bacterium]|nr:S8 family serine peptidase [Chitinispirillaceae bacterium]